jgi:hypothetical protein
MKKLLNSRKEAVNKARTSSINKISHTQKTRKYKMVLFDADAQTTSCLAFRR